MGRTKLRVELIKNEKAKFNAFEKRKKTLEKLASELSTLCGVDVALIVKAPSLDKSNKTMVWPTDHGVVSRLVASYKSRSGYDSRYRTYHLSEYFKGRTESVEDELKKLREKTRGDKYPKLGDKFNCLSLNELRAFDSSLMAKIDAVRRRINVIKARRSSHLIESNVVRSTSVQESAFFMQDYVIQQQQPLSYYHNMMERSRSLFLESEEIIQQQQSLACYDDSQDNVGNVMERSRSLFLESEFSTPDIMQQQQPHLAYNYDAQNNIGNQMMMNDGASCSYSFNESQDNYAYSSDGLWFENWCVQTGLMENVGFREVADKGMSLDFPLTQMQMVQAAREGDYFQRQLN